MIKLITFDLWNTLISGNESIHKEYRIKEICNILKKHEYNADAKEIEAGINKAWNYFIKEWGIRKYTPTTEVMVDIILENLKIEKEGVKNDVVCFMQTSILKMEIKILEGMENVIKTFSKRYKLAIISDTWFTPGYFLRKVLKDMEIFNYFNLFAFSDEIGVAKPDRRIFSYVLNYFGFKPNECLHIGDLKKTDIEGALNSGMYGVLFTKERFIDEENGVEPHFESDNAERIFDFVVNLKGGVI